MLTPDTKLHTETQLQHYNDEEADEAKTLGEIMQLAFNGMTVDQIEKEYSSKVEIVQPYKATVGMNVFGASNTS